MGTPATFTSALGRSDPSLLPEPPASTITAARDSPISEASQTPHPGRSGDRNRGGLRFGERGEDHPAGRGLNDVSNPNLDLAADPLGGLFDHHHRAVVE